MFPFTHKGNNRLTSQSLQTIYQRKTQVRQKLFLAEAEDIEYYLCGPPMMAKTVLDLLHSLGVSNEDIRFDNFG